MGNQKTERRRHPRLKGVLPLKIFKRGLDVITETKNISCSGVYCRVNKPIAVMSKIGITLLLPIQSNDRVLTKKIKCSGVVVRSEPVIVKEAYTAWQNIAIFFTDLSNKDKNKIAQYIIQRFKQEMLHNCPTAP